MSIHSPRRDCWLVFGLALMVRLLAALPQAQPNYMDAAYYLVGGQRLAQGYGFQDPYVWNYLDQPAGLPHPSHLYWMPLPSILVAIGQLLFGGSYRAAQIPFVLLSAVLPVVAYLVAWRVSAARRHAWLAALLTIFSPFYLPYWGVPESFATFAVFGALALYWACDQSKIRLLLAGACAGLAHLSRADGLLLLIPMLLMQIKTRNKTDTTKHIIPHPSSLIPHAKRSSLILIIVGYLVIMLPWFVHNLTVIGTPLAPAGAQAMWLCNYDELFSYNARLDLNHLLSCGLDRVIAAKINGVASGLTHWLAEIGMIFLAPLIVIGFWRERRQPLFRAALLYAALLFIVMTLVFTFASDRGGLFHSSGVLLPFCYAAVPIGLDTAVEWIARRRRTWNAARAQSNFSIAIVVLAIALSVVIYRGRVIGNDILDPVWNQADRDTVAIGQWLRDHGEADPIVMVNNPPSFTYETGLRSIVVPYGNVSDLLQAAQQFGARWLVLDANRPEPLAGLYADPNSEQQLTLRETLGPVRVYEIVP